jgi:hypothetical protein
MNIYTYYQQLKENDEANIWLLDVWHRSWKFYGWNPIVLTLDDAKNYEEYDKFCNVCETFPTVNNKNYEVACFVRWLTMYDKSGWITDFDVINYGFEPIDYKNEHVSLTGSMGGSTISGPNTFYKDVINTIMTYKFDPTIDFIFTDQIRHHISDLTVMDRCFKPTLINLVESRYGITGYDTSLLVHYANAYINQKNTNRYDAIVNDPRSKKFL